MKIDYKTALLLDLMLLRLEIEMEDKEDELVQKRSDDR